MKYLSFSFLLIIIFCSFTSAQDGWFWQYPLPNGYNLSKVHFINDSVGWTVGGHAINDYLQNTSLSAHDFPKILKTTDGGKNWTEQHSDIPSGLAALHFVSEYVGFAAGGESVIKTTDSGENWIQLNTIPLSAVQRNFVSVYFTSEVTGWVINEAEIFKTTNGGINWSRQEYTINDTGKTLRSIYFTSDTTGYITGDKGLILKTTNGGNTWVSLLEGMNYQLRSIFFLNDSSGWAVGGKGVYYHTDSSIVLKTTDAGNTWKIFKEPSTQLFTDVKFISPDLGYFTSSEGYIYKTTNGGINWTPVYKARNGLASLYLSSSERITAVGMNGTVVQSDDTGNKWSYKASGTFISLEWCYFISPLTGWVLGYDGTILKTTNGGEDWVSQEIDLNWNSMPRFSSVYFKNSDTGWICGGPTFKTTDGGEHWIHNINFTVSNIYFVNASLGWAVGYGQIYKTIDGGETWLTQNSGIQKTLKLISFISETTGWVAGDNRTLLKTTDGGETWTSLMTPLPDWTFRSMKFFNDSTGWIFYSYAGNDIVSKTTNSGKSWVVVRPAVNRQWTTSAFFLSDNSCLVLDSRRSILKTNNSGATWMVQKIPDNVIPVLMDIFFITPETGWIVGDGGFIIKTTDGGGSAIDTIITSVNNPDYLSVKEFSLTQNYPNPFNPSTTIKYSIPQEGFVTIKIYDILGRELVKLVDDYIQAGTYNVLWNGKSGLGNEVSSGVYFYNIRYNNSSITRKMMLIR